MTRVTLNFHFVFINLVELLCVLEQSFCLFRMVGKTLRFFTYFYQGFSNEVLGNQSLMELNSNFDLLEHVS